MSLHNDDLDRVEKLLNVVEMLRDYPKLRPLHDECLKELEELANPVEEPEEEPAKPEEHDDGA